jgi:type IV secretory pathway VirB3-like protein
MRDWKRYALLAYVTLNTTIAFIVNGNALYHLIAQHLH